MDFEWIEKRMYSIVVMNSANHIQAPSISVVSTGRCLPLELPS